MNTTTETGAWERHTYPQPNGRAKLCAGYWITRPGHACATLTRVIHRDYPTEDDAQAADLELAWQGLA